MNQESWSDVDHYLTRLLVTQDAPLRHAISAASDAGLPPIEVSPSQGKLLMLLVQLSGARRVLEIGTLAGYSTIWMARGLAAGGRLITLESIPKHADLARANVVRAGVADRVEVRLAPAVETLAQLVSEGAKPFDMVFIDADKVSNPKYLEWSMMLTKSGSVIVLANVVRGGRVADESDTDENVKGIRAVLNMIADDERLDATAIQTVGIKGWDGFAIARVR